MPDRRRTFGPVVLVGLASAALTAVAAEKPAVDGGGSSAGAGSVLSLSFDGNMPLVTALALVVLACWGVVLVTRGRVRRTVALLGVVAAAGAVVATVVAYSQIAADLRDELEQVGITGADIGHTAWYWTALAAGAVSLACCALALAWAPAWPEMGRRYDAPGGAPVPAVPPEDQSSLDLWKAIDEGHDPTAPEPE
ncbi:Trp biosynthesis-associated membrane protein [Nocardioides sp.]|uniref:Trp biosynthesis-associated membrane protein n=1 Tax=Nocardioides sp. TaxID=35761 RepID=UPI003782D408